MHYIIIIIIEITAVWVMARLLFLRRMLCRQTRKKSALPSAWINRHALRLAHGWASAFRIIFCCRCVAPPNGVNYLPPCQTNFQKKNWINKRVRDALFALPPPCLLNFSFQKSISHGAVCSISAPDRSCDPSYVCTNGKWLSVTILWDSCQTVWCCVDLFKSISLSPLVVKIGKKIWTIKHCLSSALTYF